MNLQNIIIHPTATVEEGATVGEGTRIWDLAKVRSGSTIGSGCNVGQGVYIDAGAVIGDRCKIQNYVSVYNGVTIGDDVFIGPHATFTNDLFPRAHSTDWTVVSTNVENGVSVGANATIICGVRLGAHCMIGAGAVIAKSVEPFAIVVGNPARVVGYVDVDGNPVTISTP